MPLEKIPGQKAPWPPIAKNDPLGRSPEAYPLAGNAVESLYSIARDKGLQPLDLVKYNFCTSDPKEINWYLKSYVGCFKTTRDGLNYSFEGVRPDTASNKGFIFVPKAAAEAQIPLEPLRPYRGVTLMTFVSNVGGAGPGHAALAVGPTSFTFEAMKPMSPFNPDSGWLIEPVISYLAKNEWRPVILTQLNDLVNPNRAKDYIFESDMRGDDYAKAGVCSSQAAYAIAAGLGRSFVPPGAVTTPIGLYNFAHRSGLVRSESMTWPQRQTITERARLGCEAILKKEFPKAFALL